MTEPGSDPRARLAQRQADFVAAVVLGAPGPDGMDPEWVDFTREGLVGKRWFAVRRHHPLLATALDHERPGGCVGSAHFQAWAAEHRAHEGRPLGGRVDGLTFAVWLDRQGLLPAVASAEVAAGLLTVRVGRDGRPRPRRWWGMCLARAAGLTVVGFGTHRRHRAIPLLPKAWVADARAEHVLGWRRQIKPPPEVRRDARAVLGAEPADHPRHPGRPVPAVGQPGVRP